MKVKKTLELQQVLLFNFLFPFLYFRSVTVVYTHDYSGSFPFSLNHKKGETYTVTLPIFHYVIFLMN